MSSHSSGAAVEPVQAVGDDKSATILDALRHAEGRLAVLLERLHDLVLYETDGGRDFISNNVLHLLGYAAEEFVADPALLLSLIHPEDADALRERVRRWKAHGSIGVLQSRFRARRRDGEWIWLENRMVHVTPERGEPYMSGVLVDVTRRIETEAQAQAGQERSTALLAALPDCIFLIDRDGTYLDYHAPPGARLMAEPEYFLGRSMREVMVGTDIDAHQRALERTLAHRSMQMYEYEARHSGERRHYEVRMVPCGRDRVLAIVRDISMRKRAEQAHRQSIERQHRMLSELDHRIRNNLAALISLIDLTAGESGQTVESFAATLRSRVAGMAGVHTLLSRVHWSPLRLAELVRSSILPDLGGRVASSGPELRIVPRQAIPLAMVIQELMFNSIKHGALGCAGGRVGIDWCIRSAESVADTIAVELRWRESGGPPPALPPRLGAGTSLLTGLVTFELNGRLDLSYPRSGADHLISMVLDREWESPPTAGRER